MSSGITFDLFCEDERQFTPHRIVEKDNLQTITCLTCGHERVDAMVRKIGLNMNLKKSIFSDSEEGTLDG